MPLLLVPQLSGERLKADHAVEQSELQSRLSEVQREAAVARAMAEGWQRDSKVGTMLWALLALHFSCNTVLHPAC
jgi:hypothetical protein